MKYLIVMATLLAVSCASFAAPVDLGSAGSYTLLATGTWTHGNSQYGNIRLGSATEIYGKVGARGELILDSSVIVHGDTDYGTLKQGPGASVTGVKAQPGPTYWDGVYNDLKSASAVAEGRPADKIYTAVIDTSTIFNSQDGSVFDIPGLDLSSGETLKLKGSATDKFIINVGDSGIRLSDDASIILDGVSADNVLFNMYANYSKEAIKVEGGHLAGIFIAPDGGFGLGKGSTLSRGVYLLGTGINANEPAVKQGAAGTGPAASGASSPAYISGPLVTSPSVPDALMQDTSGSGSPGSGLSEPTFPGLDLSGPDPSGSNPSGPDPAWPDPSGTDPSVPNLSVPEPTALGILCLGLVLLWGGLAWRKRQHRMGPL